MAAEEVLEVDEVIDKMLNSTTWSLGLQGMHRLVRYRHLCSVQNRNNNLIDPVEHVAYGPNEVQGLNIMKCRGSNDVMLYFHGGGWDNGNRHMHDFISHGMHLHNISVVTVGYSLSSKGTGLDQAVEDTVNAIEKAQQLFPTSNIHLAGHCAGGHLMLAALPRLRSLQGIKRVYSVSSIYDLSQYTQTTRGVLIGFTRDQVKRFSITAHKCYDQVDLRHIVATYDPPNRKQMVDQFCSEMVENGFQKKEVVVVPGEDHFSLTENLFYETSAMALIFADKYEVDQRQSDELGCRC